MVHIT